MMKLLKDKEMFCGLLVIITILLGSMMPKSGQHVLWDELFNLFIAWSICLYVVLILIKYDNNKKINKIFRVIVIMGCLGFSGFKTKDIVLDLMNGTIRSNLSQCTVYKQSGISGIISNYCYIEGIDENNLNVRIVISSNDYTELQYTKDVEIDYYKYTKRIKKIY